MSSPAMPLPPRRWPKATGGDIARRAPVADRSLLCPLVVLLALVVSPPGDPLLAAQPANPDANGDGALEPLIGSLWEMDINGDGLLQPSEVPDYARYTIRSWALQAGFDPAGPVPIEPLQQIVWEALAAEESPPVRPLNPVPGSTSGDEQTVPGFGNLEGSSPVPGFGLDSQASARTTKADRDLAADWLRRFDSNNDGRIDRREIRRTQWGGDPFQYDANGDTRLDQEELARRAAQLRTSLPPANARGGPTPDPRRPQGAQPQQPPRPLDGIRRGRQGPPDDVPPEGADGDAWYVAGNLIQRYDSDRSGGLDRTEWQAVAQDTASSHADADGDGSVDRTELAEWIQEVATVATADLPAEVPQWFRNRDANGDSQVSMAEFVADGDWTDEKAGEFMSHDFNLDGFITLEECLSRVLAGGTYVNNQLQLIPAGRTIYSNITVSDEEPVSDLSVRISITHTNDAHLDAFLIGPYGERVELFTGVGGNNDHFDNTVFDDEAPTPITSGRPPFRGTFRPEAAVRNRPSLKQFYGKSIEGTWTLMIRAERSNRPGVLHSWSLTTTDAD